MNLLETLPKDKLWIITASFLLVFIVLALVLDRLDKQLVERQLTRAAEGPDKGPYCMIDLQLFFLNGLAPRDILTRWGDEERRIARSSLLFDFAFMPAYAFLGAGALLLAAHYSKGWCQTACVYGSLFPFGAWLFDIVENVTTLRLLAAPQDATPSPGLLGLAGGATTLKWLFLALTGIFTLPNLWCLVKAFARRWRLAAG